MDNNTRLAGVSSKAHGRFWTEGVYPLYEQFIGAIHARGVERIILNSHLKTPWEDNRPVPGKVAPAGKKLLYRMSSLMLWLVNDFGNADGAPAGLVLKERLGQLMPDEDGVWRTKRMLPRRIPHCTWVDVNRYLKEGCDLADPAPGEMPSGSEMDMISELLSDAQMQLMILAAEKDLEELRQESMPMLGGEGFSVGGKQEKEDDKPGAARFLHRDGSAVEDIAAELGVPVPLVKKWLAEEG